MKKYDVKNKLEAFTVEFYNEMINNEKKREFYRIVYYLYLLKKKDCQAFDNDYLKTRTGIVWPDNEELMFNLIFHQPDTRESLNNDLLTQLDKQLVSEIYEQYKGSSLTKLKLLVLDDIKTIEIFDNLSLQQQLDITLKNYKKVYNTDEETALKTLKAMFLKHNIPDKQLKNNPQKVLIPRKKVI